LSSAELILPDCSATFRDPQGRLFGDGERVLREIYPEHVEPVLAWIRSSLAQEWIRQGRLIPTRILASVRGESAVLEHERVFFPTYPWEWTPGQWRHAASLTLDLCEEALESGYILKDATPLNILFKGSRGVFVDVLSFERREPRSPLWMAYAQFVRTFLLPLAAYIHLGWPLAATQQRRDGYEPGDLKPWLPFLRSWRHPLRSLVTLPALLEGESGPENGVRSEFQKPKVSEEISARTIRRTLAATRRLLNALTPPARASRWSGYAKTAHHYKAEDHAAKQTFVGRCLSSIRPGRILDVGANTGVYSRIAAASGADVVALDTDVRAADLNWQTAHSDGLSILPIVGDFARPTPAVGWSNCESKSLLARVEGRFDCVLMLGILHHLLVADQIPLAAVIDQLARISLRWAIVEWVPSEDPQFAELCRGREELYRHLSEGYFLQAATRTFAIRDRERLSNGRSLWLMEATR